MANTPNLLLNLPVIGGDDDIWGQELNANFSAVDAKFGTVGNASVVVQTDTNGDALATGVIIDQRQDVTPGTLKLKYNGSLRWTIGHDTAAESGGNVGHDLLINSYKDDGSFLASLLSINRQAGIVNFGITPQVGANVIFHAGNTQFIGQFREPIGTVKMWAGVGINNADPPAAEDGIIHYMICDGRSLNASADTSLIPLFNVIVTTYGGTGQGAFNLPNLMERVVVGKSITASLVPGSSTLGNKFGAAQHLLDATQMPVHSHTLHDSGHVHDFGYNPQTTSGGSGGAMNMNATTTLVSGAVKSATTGITIDPAGGTSGVTQPHNNLQPSIVLNYIIRVR